MAQDEMQFINRIPPNDQDAELAVLSCMLFDPDAVAASSEMLSGEDFYRPDYKAVFESMIELFNRNVPVDLITLKNKLDEKGILDQIGGRDTLARIAGNVSTSVHIKHYAQIVAEKAVLRRLIKAAGNITSISFDAKEKVSNIIDFAEKAIFDISQNRNASGFSHVQDILIDSIKRIEDIYKSGEKITGLPTGFADFDLKTAGLQPSDLILIAARPSMGKSALVLNIAQQTAFKNKLPTAIFSLEMSKEQLVNRLLCAEGMIDSQNLRTGKLDQTDWEKIADTVGTIADAPLYIDDTPGITVSEVRAKCRKLKLEKGLSLIIIDYLQLMSGSGRESRQQEISEISRSLKALAREMQAPVIALSQLSRACEQRADHRPMLSDLRESGAIEQDADVVCFIYRDEYYNPDTEKKGMAELIIAKQRNGPTGTIELMYLGKYTKFVSAEKNFL